MSRSAAPRDAWPVSTRVMVVTGRQARKPESKRVLCLKTHTGNRARLSFTHYLAGKPSQMVICTNDAAFTQSGTNLEKLFISRKEPLTWL